MTDTIELRIRVPSDQADKLRRMVYREMYSTDPTTKAIFELIRDNPKIPLSKLLYRARREGLISAMTVAGMKKIAECSGLDFVL